MMMMMCALGGFLCTVLSKDRCLLSSYSVRT